MTIASEVITCADLCRRVALFKETGWRFVTMTCVMADDDNAELLYHFDRDLTLNHLRLKIYGVVSLPSICGIYSAAYLVENEIQDQFGLSFTGLEPNYLRTLYLQGEDSLPPFRGKIISKKGEQ